MVELTVLAALAFSALLVVGVLLSIFSAVSWMLWLPFKMLGWGLKLLAALIALPFLLIACVIGGFAVLLGAGVLVIPFLPLLLIGGLVWLLFRPRRSSQGQARFVS